ncbi:glycine cleavage system protein R [Vibrio caribbeanicus]|uniref:glycine cleavage system protein R n=1 Tax=Vibrio caribbeanicus TaxID=701175 RepID=UPI0030DA131F
MTQHLVITAVGTDRPGICNQIVRLVNQSGCNIVDSRIALFGDEFTLIMLLNGSNASVTRIETMLPPLGQQHELITITKRTSKHNQIAHSSMMEATIDSDDRPGLIEHFTQFFADRNIGLSSLSAQSLEKVKCHAQENHFHISISASLGEEINLLQLREEFDQLCNSLVVDGSLNFLTNHQ